MEEHFQTVYLREAMTQCEFALNAVRGLNNVLPRLDSDSASDDWRLRITLHQEVFRSIHSFLTHASNVSRMFWPSPPRQKKGEATSAYKARCLTVPRVARGAAIRAAANLPEDHLLRNRQLRDHLEHFDERIDIWRSTSVSHNYLQDYIGPQSGIEGFEPTDMMRWFDPTTKQMRFRGEEFDLQGLADGITEVHQKCDNAINRIQDRRRSGASSGAV